MPTAIARVAVPAVGFREVIGRSSPPIQSPSSWRPPRLSRGGAHDALPRGAPSTCSSMRPVAALPDATKWCQPLEHTVTSDATTSAFAARRVDESEGRR